MRIAPFGLVGCFGVRTKAIMSNPRANEGEMAISPDFKGVSAARGVSLDPSR
jgi:hypothetical protein